MILRNLLIFKTGTGACPLFPFYFGAKFGENIVVFENVDYGNALYILFDNWQEISQMSRIDILKRHEHDFVRIVHKDGWEKALKRKIDELKSQS